MGMTQNVTSLGSYVTVNLRFDIALWCKQLQLFVCHLSICFHDNSKSRGRIL